MPDEQPEDRGDPADGWETRKVTMKVRRAGRWLQAKIGKKRFIMLEVEQFKLPTDSKDIPF